MKIQDEITRESEEKGLSGEVSSTVDVIHSVFYAFIMEHPH